MKREIKFRAYGTEYGGGEIKMRYSDESPDIPCFWTLYVGNKQEYAEAIMQYTGLHDKNGKEIYEGDIVTWSDGEYKHYSNPRIAVVEFNPELSFYAVNVVEHSGLCKYTDRLNHGHKFGYSNFAYSNTENHLEIAGNIYENRNLLDY